MSKHTENFIAIFKFKKIEKRYEYEKILGVRGSLGSLLSPKIVTV